MLHLAGAGTRRRVGELSVCPALAHTCPLTPVLCATPRLWRWAAGSKGARTCLSRDRARKGPLVDCKWAVHAASQSSLTRMPRRWSSRSSPDMAPVIAASGQPDTGRASGAFVAPPQGNCCAHRDPCDTAAASFHERRPATVPGEPQTGRATLPSAACRARRQGRAKTPPAHTLRPQGPVPAWRPRRAARRASAATTTGPVTTRRYVAAAADHHLSCLGALRGLSYPTASRRVPSHLRDLPVCRAR